MFLLYEVDVSCLIFSLYDHIVYKSLVCWVQETDLMLRREHQFFWTHVELFSTLSYACFSVFSCIIVYMEVKNPRANSIWGCA